MSTKASQIMALHREGKCTRDIALQVYGEVTESRLAYVRIVARQRNGNGRFDEVTNAERGQIIKGRSLLLRGPTRRDIG